MTFLFLDFVFSKIILRIIFHFQNKVVRITVVNPVITKGCWPPMPTYDPTKDLLSIYIEILVQFGLQRYLWIP